MKARIGIDLGGTKIQGVVLESDGRISAQRRTPTPKDAYGRTLDAIVSLAEELDAGRSLTIGVGTPGSLLPEGLIHNSNSLWLNGRALLSDLERKLGLRVRIANDADCFALSEASNLGSAAGSSVVFGVILGTGVGGGLVVDGRLLRGRNGLAGEWGHTPLPYFRGTVDEAVLSARRCYCGRLNCIETFLSGAGLVRTYKELAGERAGLDSAEEVCGLAFSSPAAMNVERVTREHPGMRRSRSDGINPARRALTLYCSMLARSLAQVINVLDPHAVVLGGGLSNVTELYEPVRARLPEYVFGGRCETALLAPRWGDASGVRGAAWLWDAETNEY